MSKKVNSTGQSYAEETLKVADLIVDHDIQRFKLDLAKVERIVANFNPAAVGVITVSRRKFGDQIILDGWHRVQAIKELTDGAGTVLCHVHEGLEVAEEAQLFLDLNAGNQPTLLEKFRARKVAGDPVAQAIAEITAAYHWSVDPEPRSGNVQCVGALERIYRRSEKMESDPNQLLAAFLVITRAWDYDRFGAQAVILEGISSVYGYYGSKLNLDRLVEQLKVYKNGPHGLHTDATQMAKIRHGKVSMAVAELIVNHYNKGLRTGALPTWTKRNP